MLFTIRRRSQVSLLLARVGRTRTLYRRVNEYSQEKEVRSYGAGADEQKANHSTFPLHLILVLFFSKIFTRRLIGITSGYSSLHRTLQTRALPGRATQPTPWFPSSFLPPHRTFLAGASVTQLNANFPGTSPCMNTDSQSAGPPKLRALTT
jgi:hypothetical protein